MSAKKSNLFTTFPSPIYSSTDPQNTESQITKLKDIDKSFISQVVPMSRVSMEKRDDSNSQGNFVKQRIIEKFIEIAHEICVDFINNKYNNAVMASAILFKDILNTFGYQSEVIRCYRTENYWDFFEHYIVQYDYILFDLGSNIINNITADAGLFKLTLIIDDVYHGGIIIKNDVEYNEKRYQLQFLDPKDQKIYDLKQKILNKHSKLKDYQKESL